MLQGGTAAFLGLTGLPAAADTGGLDRQILAVSGDSRTARKALVLTPRRPPPKGGYPTLVLFHGLAETTNPELGLRAWADRYGLVAADERLRRGSVAAPTPNRYLTEARAAAIDAELRTRPYRGFVVVCPFTPNVYEGGATIMALDRYASWVTDALLPAVRRAAPVRPDPMSTRVDGCSLGGYVALEVFLRKPEFFGAVGGVQSAYGERMALVYARRLRETLGRVGPRAIHIETSVWDPSLKAHRILNDELRRAGVDSDLTVLPGGHDQNFLREVGALEMLLWHDRRTS